VCAISFLTRSSLISGSYNNLSFQKVDTALCNECGATGLCSKCTELWIAEIDLEDTEAEEE